MKLHNDIARQILNVEPPPNPSRILEGQGQTVAVCDTGFDKGSTTNVHAAFAGRVETLYALGRTNNPNDPNGHGTHVAGTVGAINNLIGVVGIAPDASLYAVRVLDRNGSGRISSLILALEWCANNGIDVANMSLGLDSNVQSLGDACDAAAASVILVGAAGNDGSDVDYPGAYSSVIAVAAVDDTDARAYFSSFGPPLLTGLSAPGVSVPSTWKGNGYNTISGTSMATPHVTGAIALNLSGNWLTMTSCGCTAAFGFSGDHAFPSASISTSRIDPRMVEKVDLTRDGIVDFRDVREFERINGLSDSLSTSMLQADLQNRRRR